LKGKSVTAKPEWEIPFEEYLKRLDIGEDRFRARLDLPVVGRIKKVLPLKDMKVVSSLVPLTQELLFRILKGVKTNDGQRPFRNTEFEMMKFDPLQLRIGQKFAYRENYINLLEGLSDVFAKDYAINPGITRIGAYVVFGKDGNGENALAYYIPPIVEFHNNEPVIMDGIHRNYITLKVGGTIYAIVARTISVPFPCSGRSWKEIKVISLTEKPKDMKERYFDLRQELFRDLKHLGIDG
jgi:hypothetical protein